MYDTDDNWNNRTTYSSSFPNDSAQIRITLINKVATLYVDNVQIASKTLRNQCPKISIWTQGNARATKVKDIIVKPL